MVAEQQRVQGARPLLPFRARRPALIIAVCCVLVTLVLGVLTAHTSHPGPLDAAVDSWIQRTVGAHRRILQLLEEIGEPTQVALLTLAIMLGCLAARRVNGAVLTAVSVAVSVTLTEAVLKPIVSRTLNGARVYPSGHTGLAFTLAAVIVVLLLNPRRRLRLPLIIAIAAVAALVGSAVAVAMISLHFHYFTDTVGGAALAIGVVLTISFLLDTDAVRRRLRVADPSHRRASVTEGTKPDVTSSSQSATPKGRS